MCVLGRGWGGGQAIHMGINEGMRMAWYIWRIANSSVWNEGMQGENSGQEFEKVSRRQIMKDFVCTAVNFYSILWVMWNYSSFIINEVT